jgi:hypothetical protein
MGEASARETGSQVVSTRRPERFKERGRNPLELRLFLNLGAEEGTRTPTWEPTLDPEPSASTNSATSARGLIG